MNDLQQSDASGASAILARRWARSSVPASALHLVTPAEIDQLRGEFLRGYVPPDLDVKVRQLLDRDLMHKSLARSCLWFVALLEAYFAGHFRLATSEQVDLMLRVLAYVRKDEDAIHDLQPDGYTDDQQEMRMACVRLRSLLQAFKHWRLRHVVPVLWHSDQRQPIACCR